MFLNNIVKNAGNYFRKKITNPKKSEGLISDLEKLFKDDKISDEVKNDIYGIIREERYSKLEHVLDYTEGKIKEEDYRTVFNIVLARYAQKWLTKINNFEKLKELALPEDIKKEISNLKKTITGYIKKGYSNKGIIDALHEMDKRFIVKMDDREKYIACRQMIDNAKSYVKQIKYLK